MTTDATQRAWGRNVYSYSSVGVSQHKSVNAALEEINGEEGSFISLVDSTPRKAMQQALFVTDNNNYIANTPLLALKGIVLRKARIAKMTRTALEACYVVAKDAYYNTGKPIVADKVFDAIEDHIRAKWPSSPVLNMIGSSIKLVNLPGKVTLPFWMGSMDKVKDVSRFGGYDSYYATEKLDGVSLLYVNDKGTAKLYTRGDGRVGQDVSHLLPVMKLPKLKAGQAVRGELIMSKTSFKKFAKEFKNARNMIAGMANAKEASPNLKATDFVAFEMLAPRMKPSDALASMKRQGFKTPWGKAVKDLGELHGLLDARKKASPYEIDGLVIYDNSKAHKVNTSGNPVWAFAFKDNATNTSALVRVVEVEWNLTRHGQIKPVIIVEPV